MNQRNDNNQNVNQGDNVKNRELNRNVGQNIDDENIQGSTLTPEERELRKYDDWKSHTHEHNRDPKAEFREGELHGVVGKEIHDLLKQEKEQQVHSQQGNVNLKTGQQQQSGQQQTNSQQSTANR